MIGIDIVNLERFEAFLAKFPNKALARFLCEEEIALATSSQTAAGFFAAKEAISKALGTGIGKECSFFDIKIHKDLNKAPFFTLDKRLTDAYAITECALSISHDGGFVIAVATISSSTAYNKPVCH